MLPSSSFFSPAEVIIEAKVGGSHDGSRNMDIESVYEIEKCTEWIYELGFKRVSQR